jgi:NCAIR mutase (PurE)-related protein
MKVAKTNLHTSSQFQGTLPKVKINQALAGRCTTRVNSSNNGGSPVTGANPALLELLENVASGVLTASDAAVQLNQVSSAANTTPPMSLANFPECVWGEGKAAQQIATSLQRVADRQGLGAATRVGGGTAAEVQQLLPDAQYNPIARTLVLKSTTTKQIKLPGTVALLTAGSAQQQVVEECRVMLQALGIYSFKLPEAGVMGMHRIVQNIEAVRAADVIICITGMDGGAATVIAGMVECPVIALPTSSGYGSNFAGVAPLLAALNSSAPGVTVVNIDSGFGAAMAAWRTMKCITAARDAVLNNKN